MPTLTTVPREAAKEVHLVDALVTTLNAVAALKEADLTSSHGESLAVLLLAVSEPMAMSELADSVSLSRAAVTSLVDRLEERKLIKRTPDLKDRRRQLLDMTPTARRRIMEAL